MNDTTQQSALEKKIFACFAAARQGKDISTTVDSFIDVEHYESKVMYPTFAKWAVSAGYPAIGTLFRKVAGEERLHAVWMEEIGHRQMSKEHGEDTVRAMSAIESAVNDVEKLLEKSPKQLVVAALQVAIRVEEREYKDIYPRFRDQAACNGNSRAAAVYQRVIDSEKQHARLFGTALQSVVG